MNTTNDQGHLDTSRRYVHLRREREDGFVEFDFALGDLELNVELILPRSAYEAFCRQPGTIELSDEQFNDTEEKVRAYLYGGD